ncbi:hypothetical protein MMC14_007767 [Varicellaria rhodocarpa]|nr:hypothetical protein [Varicellaria rhodocarpa]
MNLSLPPYSSYTKFAHRTKNEKACGEGTVRPGHLGHSTNHPEAHPNVHATSVRGAVTEKIGAVRVMTMRSDDEIEKEGVQLEKRDGNNENEMEGVQPEVVQSELQDLQAWGRHYLDGGENCGG